MSGHREYTEDIAITFHRIDKNWLMRTSVLELKRFTAPHTGDASCQFIYELIKAWGLEKSLMAITTENSSDMISAIRKLNNSIHTELEKTDSTVLFENFHILFIAHIVNLAVK